MFNVILYSLFQSLYLGITMGFIIMFFLTFQKVIFLEYHEPKKERQIYAFVCIILGVTGLGNFITFLFRNQALMMTMSTLWSILMVVFLVVLFIYNSFTGRKHAKWLAFFEFIPMIGYYLGTISVVGLDFLNDNSNTGTTFVYLAVCLVCIIVFFALKKIKPVFIDNLEKDIKNRSLSVWEEVIVWGVGIWLFLSDMFLSSETIRSLPNTVYVYIKTLDFLVAVLVVIFIITSNYRAYYNKKNMELQESLVLSMAKSIEAKDRYTKGHSSRVAKYSKMLAARMGKTESEQENIYKAALLHDVGKIRVPEEVINKGGKLTDKEFDYIKLHPVAGYNILKDIKGASDLSIGAKYHHERYDGKGYPYGFAGENIPEIARIIAVADSYDAMASNRSYRKALPQETIKDELKKGMGTQFDPKIAQVMLDIMEEDVEYKLREKDILDKTILVVDDDNINLKLAAKILETVPNYHVLKAGSGQETIKILSENEIDLILLDIVMPEMDGFDTLKKIREISQVKVFFTSADKEMSTYERAYNEGVKDYITKPFFGPGLLESVYGALYSDDTDNSQ